MPRAPRSPAAKPTSWSWSGKSSSAGRPRSRTNGISSSVSALKTSPNTRKSRHAGAARRRPDPRQPPPEERGVDVPRRVDPDPVDPVPLDPGRVDVREAAHDVLALREEVVEPEEVALLEARRVARREVDVAPVVVARRVVQPRGLLRGAVGGGDERHARHEPRGHARERLADVRRGPERLAAAVAVRHLLRPDVAAAAAGERDDVARVVDDDVEDHLQPERVGAGHEGAELLLRPEVPVGRREVGDPVAVIARAVALHRPLAERRREPDGGEAEVRDPREAVGRTRARAAESGEVAAVEPTGVGRVEPGHRASARLSSPSFDGSPFA